MDDAAGSIQDPSGRRRTSASQRRWAALLALSVLLAASLFWVAVGADADGLSTYRELRIGSDPFKADSDTDGLTDGWEVDRGLDPLVPDTDRDGLLDGDEVRRHGSDPLLVDTDEDHLDDGDEVRRGTDPARADTDGDGAPDGVEVEHGADPLVVDTDDDGLDDAYELRHGLDARAADSDGDGLLDDAEAAAQDTDCDDDGLHVAADRDDDADGLPDADEDPAWRCAPDVDQDGVPDGAEGASSCIVAIDCDLDGLDDTTEHADLAFDPLRPDTFDVGLLDSVVWAFRERGQTPSSDDDGDAIPDGWEDSGGLIDWGPYRPRAGQMDLLVEYVRVQGPQSHKVANLDFTPAYRTVADAFADAGITMQWVETRVVRNQESRPAILPSFDDPYYEEVLRGSRHGLNPYVLTVVMNPQHDQSQIQHAGIAPIRGMLAAVDYGFFTRMVFEANNQTVTFHPYWESLIAAGTESGQYGRTLENAGATPQGEFWVAGDGFRAYWSPLWYQTAPRFEFDSGAVIQTSFSHATVAWGELAGVLMHEIGHTLGLCHLELSDCRSRLQPEETSQVARSSMYSASALSRVAFLETEWNDVRTYLGCPPQGPIALLAAGSGDQAIYQEKYQITMEQVLNVDARRCGDHRPITRAFEADFGLGGHRPPTGRVEPARLDGPHMTYVAPAAMADPGPVPDPWLPLGLLVVGSLAAAYAASRVPARWPERGPWSRSGP